MSALRNLKPSFIDQGSDQDQKIQNQVFNLTEKMPSTKKLPDWVHANWFKAIKIGLCVFCFPLIYVVGKFLVDLIK